MGTVGLNGVRGRWRTSQSSKGSCARKTGTPLWKTADFRGILAESRLFLSCFFVSFFFVAVFFQKNAGERVYFSRCFWSRKREFVKRESAEEREKKERRRRPNRGDGVAGAVAPLRIASDSGGSFISPSIALSLAVLSSARVCSGSRRAGFFSAPPQVRACYFLRVVTHQGAASRSCRAQQTFFSFRVHGVTPLYSPPCSSSL